MPFKKGQSSWNKGKRWSQKTKEKMKFARIGKSPWNKGKHYTKKQLKKINLSGLCKGRGWNKGLKTGLVPKSAFKKGDHLNSKTEFKKGLIPWNKNKKYLQITGEKHHYWKGDEVGYHSLHSWVRRWKGKADHCEMCGEDKKYSNPKHYQWANIDHKYRRVLEDFIPLCTKCHKNYDKKFNS